MATQHYNVTPVWGLIGGTVRLGGRPGTRVTVTDTAGTPVTVIQDGRTQAGYVLVSADGTIAAFTHASLSALILSTGGITWTVYSSEAITSTASAQTDAAAAAASAAAAAASASTAAGYVTSKVDKDSVVVDIRDHGAVAGTNCTAALTASVAAVAGSGTVFVPPGVWKTSGVTLTSGVRLRVDGTLQMLAGGTGRLITVADVGNVEITGSGTLDMNKSATTNGGSNIAQQAVYASYTSARSGLKVSGVAIVNCWQRAIQVTATSAGSISDVVIDGVSVSAVGESGIVVQATGNADKTTPSTSSGVTVSRCRVTPGFHGIMVAGMSNARVHHCEVDGAGATGSGIIIGGSTTGTGPYTYYHVTDSDVRHNVVRAFTTSTRWGIVATVSSTRLSITSNMVRGCAGGITVDPEDGIVAPGVETDVAGVVAGNVVTGSTSSHGINVRLSRGVVVTGNVCTGNYEAGLAVSSATALTISGNQLRNNGHYGLAIFGTSAGGGHVADASNVCTGNNTRSLSDGADIHTVATPNSNTLPTRAVVKSAATSRPSTTSRTADPHLTTAVYPGRYELRAVLYYTAAAATAADLAISWTAPAGTVLRWGVDGLAGAATSSSGAQIRSALTVSDPVTVGGADAQAVVATITGSLTVTTAGTLSLDWAQSVSNATATVVLEDSSLTLTSR